MSTYHFLLLAASVGGNAFVFAHLFYAFGRGKWLFVAVPWFAIMSMAFYVNIITAGNDKLHIVLAQAENLWLPLTLICSVLFGLSDAFFLLRRLYRRSRGIHKGRGPYKIFVQRLLALALVLTAYGLYEAYSPRAVEHTLYTNKLPQGVGRLRLAFVTDIHINDWIGPRTVRKIADIIQEQHPDMILLGGDIVDADMTFREAELEALWSLNAPYGKFAVLGNHEELWGIEESCAFFRAAGFTVLRNQFVEAGGLILVGVDDPNVAYHENTRNHLPGPLLQSLRDVTQNRFIVLLKHRHPAVPDAVGLFDLQLSGHTHGWQIWPLRHILRKAFNVSSGRWIAASPQGESTILVSVGTGFSRIPLRYFTPPEVVIVDLVAQP